MSKRKKDLYNYDPASGELIGSYSVADQDEVLEKMDKARQTFQSWKNSSLHNRSFALSQLRRYINDNMGDLVEIICRDTGKVRQEALMADIYPTLEIIKYYEKNLTKILRPQKRSTPLSALGSISWIEYYPRGVVAIISPWNYPLQLALVPLITAIAAGNAAILKPSEITPLTGQTIIDILSNVEEIPTDLVQIIHGEGEVGSNLVETDPDMIFFTGSVRTGKKIMKAASHKLIPVELELGGKDPFIVLNGANLERASEAAVYSAFANTGQLCISTERLYVDESVAEEFVALVKSKTEQLRAGQGLWGDLGPFTHPNQGEHVSSQVQDALDKGAKLITGDVSNVKSGRPVILSQVDHSMDVMWEETFGPIMPIMTFSSKKEAVNLANDSQYGLNASIWSENSNKAQNLASQLETGNCIINDVIRNVGNPSLPFGGVKLSGIGRYHGPEGLINFSHTKSIMHNKINRNKEINWFPFGEERYRDIKDFLKLYFSDSSIIKKAVAIPTTFARLLRKMK